jgi:hypothetical protein
MPALQPQAFLSGFAAMFTHHPGETAFLNGSERGAFLSGGQTKGSLMRQYRIKAPPERDRSGFSIPSAH